MSLVALNRAIWFLLLLIAITLVETSDFSFQKVSDVQTMCAYKTISKTCVQYRSQNEEAVRRIINDHNMARSIFAGGRKGYFIPNMMKMYWDQELAELSARLACQCKVGLDTDKSVAGFHIGQVVWTVMHQKSFAGWEEIWNNIIRGGTGCFQRNRWGRMLMNYNSSDPLSLIYNPYVQFVGCTLVNYVIWSTEASDFAYTTTLVCIYGPLKEEYEKHLKEDRPCRSCPKGKPCITSFYVGGNVRPPDLPKEMNLCIDPQQEYQHYRPWKTGSEDFQDARQPHSMKRYTKLWRRLKRASAEYTYPPRDVRPNTLKATPLHPSDNTDWPERETQNPAVKYPKNSTSGVVPRRRTPAINGISHEWDSEDAALENHMMRRLSGEENTPWDEPAQVSRSFPAKRPRQTTDTTSPTPKPRTTTTTTTTTEPTTTPEPTTTAPEPTEPTSPEESDDTEPADPEDPTPTEETGSFPPIEITGPTIRQQLVTEATSETQSTKRPRRSTTTASPGREDEAEDNIYYDGQGGVEGHINFCELECVGHVKHTLCAFQGTSPDCGTFTSFTNPGAEQDLLNIHNKFRDEYAGGKIGPPHPLASNMVRLRWSKQLRNSAFMWLRQCKLRHDFCRDAILVHPATDVETTFRVSQNIGWQSYHVNDSSPSYRELFDQWKNQKSNFTWKGFEDYLSFSKDERPLVEDFVQLVWARTYFVGCAFGSFAKHESKTAIAMLVCNYAPVGKEAGREIYIPGGPCANCQTETLFKKGHCMKEYPNLCDSSTVPPSHTGLFIYLLIYVTQYTT